MAIVKTDGISIIESMVATSGVEECNGNKFIVLSQEIITMTLGICSQTGKQAIKRICNRFKGNSFYKVVLLYQRHNRKDNQELAKEFLGVNFNFTTDLYNTLSLLRDPTRDHAGNSNPIYLIYDNSNDNFDMKNAFSIINQSIVSYFNKEAISSKVKNFVELLYPPYESWRWRTPEEIKHADYAHNYLEERNLIKNPRSTSNEKQLDKIKEMCNNYFKSLIDRKEYEEVEDSFLAIYDVMDMNRKEARYNKRHRL